MQLEFNFVPANESGAAPAAPAASAPEQAPEPRPPSTVARRAAAERLRWELARRVRLEVSLTVTDNRSSIVSFKYDRTQTRVQVRLHHMFLSAPPEVVKALAHWIEHPRSKKMGAIVDRFIHENNDRIGPPRPRRIQVDPQGACFDLRTIFTQLNATYFEGTVTAAITWGNMPRRRRRRRSIRYGTFTEDDHLIRIHPLLDQAFVPEYFVRYVVFHEMLHAYLGIAESRTATGRRRIHTGEFKQRERAYPDYARAIAWQEDNANFRRLLNGRGPSFLKRLAAMQRRSDAAG